MPSLGSSHCSMPVISVPTVLALLEPELEVARLCSSVVQPALLEGLRVGASSSWRGRRPAASRRLGGQHAGLDGGVAALDARGVQVAGVAAHQRAAGEHRLGQALQAAVVDGARAVADALAAFDVGADRRVRLPALHLLERAHPGVLVVQPGDEAQRDLVAFQVVQEAAAVGVSRPSASRRCAPPGRAGLRGVDLPQFLDADGVALRVAAFVELEAWRSAACPGGRARLRRRRCTCRAVPCRAGSRRAARRPCRCPCCRWPRRARAPVVVEHLGRREAGEDLDAQRLGLLGQPRTTRPG
jgi:hypothetical protein